MGLTIATLFAVLASPLAATPTEIEIETAGPRCEGPSLSARVESLLEGGPRPAGSWMARTTLQQGDETWTAAVWIRSPSGTTSRREFQAAQCDTVLQAAALVLAVAIDPTVTARLETRASPDEPAADTSLPSPPTQGDPPQPQAVPEPAPAGEPPPAATESNSPDSPPARKPPPPAIQTSRPTRFGLRVEGGVDGGALPSLGGEVGLAFAVMRPAWRIELTARGRLPRDVESPQPGVGGEVWAWRLGLRACGRVLAAESQVDVALCGGGESGGIVARGVGFEGAQQTQVPWLAFVAAPGVFYVPHPRVALGVLLEGGISALRPTLRIEGIGEVFQVGRVFGRALAAVEIRWGG